MRCSSSRCSGPGGSQMSNQNDCAIGVAWRVGMEYKSNTRSIEHSFDIRSTDGGVAMSAALIEAPEQRRVEARPSGARRASASPDTRRSSRTVNRPNSRPGSQPGTRRGRRPSRGSARAGRPVGRSVTAVAPPRIGPAAAPTMPSGVRSCRVERAQRVRAVQAAQAGWRLTERGIAVVLIAGAVLAAAAVTVITATALTVTSEDYRPAGSSLHAPR